MSCFSSKPKGQGGNMKQPPILAVKSLKPEKIEVEVNSENENPNFKITKTGYIERVIKRFGDESGRG